MTAMLVRTLEVDRTALAERAEGDGLIPVSLSSALPVERWFGDEILEHTPEAINMERAARGLPVLFNHDTGTVVGRLINCGLRADGRFGGDLKFGRSTRAQEIRQDVVDEVLTDMSVGYRIDKWVESQRDGKDVYTATRWTPMEASIVPVPADHTVGINRSADRAAHPVINTRAPEQGKEQQMSENVPTPATAVVTSHEEPIAREEQRKLIAVAGRTFGMEGDALKAISEGKSLDEFRAVVEAEQVRRAAAEKPAGHIDLSERESGAYNPGKAIFALANGGRREGLEFEVSREIAKRNNKETDGFFMPLNIRAAVPGQTATTASLGGSAVQTTIMPIIDILRAKLVSAQAGATYLTGLSGNLQFPRQITGNTFAWVGENPSSANTVTGATFDTVTLTPHTGIGDSAFSRQVLAQTSQDMQAWVINELLSTVAVGIDNAVFNGTDANNQPKGLRGQSSIGNRTLGAAGAALTWADIVGFESDVAAGNADVGRLSYVTNSKVRGKLKTTLQNTVAGASYIWGGGNDPGTVNGYNAFVSNQLPSNLTQGTATTICSSIIFGNFADLLVGEFGGGVEVLVNPYLYAGQGMISVHTIAMIDVAIRHYESFSKSDAVLTT